MAHEDVDWSDWEEYNANSEDEDIYSNGEISGDDESDFADNNDAALEAKKAELVTILHLLDTEQPTFNFQPVENHNNMLPPFDNSKVGSKHSLPSSASPLEYFQQLRQHLCAESVIHICA